MVLNLSLSEVVTSGIHYKTHITNVKVYMFVNRRSDNGMDQAACISYANDYQAVFMRDQT